MQDAGKVRFLDTPISLGGLFGNTVEIFLQQLTAVKKQMEVIRHILPQQSTGLRGPAICLPIAEATPLNGGPPAGR